MAHEHQPRDRPFTRTTNPKPFHRRDVEAMDDDLPEPREDELAVYAVGAIEGVLGRTNEELTQALRVLYVTPDGEQAVEAIEPRASFETVERVPAWRVLAVDHETLQPVGETAPAPEWIEDVLEYHEAAGTER